MSNEQQDMKVVLEGIIEQLAEKEHERWSHWQRYVHSVSTPQPDGGLRIPPSQVSKWERQIHTQYRDLTEEEKESDREQVRKYLSIIENAFSRIE